MSTNQKKLDKIAGAVYGFAIGDAMGATTEFMTSGMIKRRFGKVTHIIGGGWLNLKPGEVTDDTQMTMCVMNALMNVLSSKPNVDDHDYKTKFIDYEFMQECRKEFIKWYKSVPKDVGNQCSKAIHYMITKDQLDMDKDVNALGNGSLMRALPCALLDMPMLNDLQGRMTHNNLQCTLVLQNYTRMIKNYLNGNKYVYKVEGLVEPTGHIINTFNNSLYWSSKDSFEDAILGAVNHGGDADTIAAITGSLAGARFGMSKIPNEWIKELDYELKKELNKFINFVFKYID